jgi:hypothetical protein
MRARWTFLVLALGLALGVGLFVGLTIAQEAAPQEALGTAFTYQGQLQQGGLLVDDTCDMAFRLYDQAADGSQVGDPITTTVPITGGLFTVGLDFGASAFTGDARWLAVTVQCPDDLAWTALPRQALTAAPYALYSLEAGNANTVDGQHASAFARIGRYYIPGGGGTVTIPIPHYNAFQISLGEAFGYPQKAAWLSGIENDGQIAWVGIDATGSVVTGSAALDTTDTILTLGTDITLACPGNGEYELKVTSTYEDVRLFIIW